LIEAILIYPHLIEALGPYQMLLFYSNVSNFTQNIIKFLVGPNLMKAAGITTWFQFTPGQCLFCHQGQK